MKNLLSLDYNYMMAPVLGIDNGITDDDISGLRDLAMSTADRIENERSNGKLLFLEIDRLEEYLPVIKETASYVKDRFDTIVVFGIGGSALGTNAVKDALRYQIVDGGVEVIVADNIDPSCIYQLIESLDIERTAFNIISKSGGTIETLAQFMIIKGILSESLGKDGYRERMIFTTDPEKGELRKIAKNENIRTLEVPPDIGGRFSVLTSVGLFPVEVMGIDSKRILKGAKIFDELTRGRPWHENPAYIYGLLIYISSSFMGKNISVIMPYSSELKNFAHWYAQIWAESLGKEREEEGKKIGVGQTPVVAIGVTDQHSKLQLFVEGPDDKVITFLSIKKPSFDIEIPKLYEDIESLGSLSGKKLGNLFSAERETTEAALSYKGRMSMTIEIPHISEETLGALFYFFFSATTFTGYLLGINPFGQPGVEEGKKYTWGIMGRPGYEAEKEKFIKRPEKLDKYILRK